MDRKYLQELIGAKSFDIAIIGGGIHGACVAHLSALMGFSTVLLEKNDFASGTSSRSSKMLHGGLRYLELLDFKQVFEGIKGREIFFEIAPHLTQEKRFFIPVFDEQGWYRTKIKIGLTVYDFAHRDKARWHQWIDWSEVEFSKLYSSKKRLKGGYLYTDGLMDDCRLTQEFINSAISEGALCINYAEAFKIEPSNSRVTVFWQDAFGSCRGQFEARLVLNCAGPWVGEVCRDQDLLSRIKFSCGSHLLFNQPWEYNPLFLPLDSRGRYYFVWPHRAGTLVGTTERELTHPLPDPMPSSDEVEEILNRVRTDLPHSGLCRENAHYCYSGIRTLFKRKTLRSKSDTSAISRRPLWFQHGRMLSLIGGKFTTAPLTAKQGLEIACKILRDHRHVPAANAKKLPGAVNYGEITALFRSKCIQRMIPDKVMERVIANLGSHVKYFWKNKEDEDDNFNLIGELALKGEVRYALECEQAVTIEDLMRRRLGLEFYAGNGLSALEGIAETFQNFTRKNSVSEEVAQYRERIKKIQLILNPDCSLS